MFTVLCVCVCMLERQTETMKRCTLLSLLLVTGCVYIHAAPVDQTMESGKCDDAAALGAAEEALTKINQAQLEGYILRLHRLSNVHTMAHGDTGIVYYLTLDVEETGCHVLSRKEWKTCEARSNDDTPVYGQCKAAIYINKPHRVVRLYKYNCAIRPSPAAKVAAICPDCPSLVAKDSAEIQKAVELSLEKYNKENGLTKYFALLSVSRASSQMGMATFWNVEYTIQETTCTKSSDGTKPDNCPHMNCEFAHKGFCKASHSFSMGNEEVTAECEIYEPEAAEKEKELHQLAVDHSHNDTHAHDHDHTQDQGHDHVHDHTKSHGQHERTHTHAANSDHHHTHDHGHGSPHSHAHDHTHDHGHGHDHVHAHHAKAHDHSGDSANHHHDYKHATGTHTHEHDHEHALDHDHKHAHLHSHEHHHHHHDHVHETTPHHEPEGEVRMLVAMDQPMTLPSFPDEPAAGPEVGVTLPLRPDPQIPGQQEPTVLSFPKAVSADCPVPAAGDSLVQQLFAEDAAFKPAA